MEQLRNASKEFPVGTSWTYDGFHPRHYDLLSDSALEVLSMILESAECLGTMPLSARSISVALIPKPKGGTRPIGLFPSPYRIWAKARLPLAQAWEDENWRAYFACAKGSGAADVVWAQAVRAEAGASSDKFVAACLWDLASFFDTIDHERLFRMGEKYGYPMQVLRMALSAYSAPRVVQTREGRSSPVNPNRGIVPGCTLAKSLVNLYYLEAMDGFMERNGDKVGMDIYIDDITVSTVQDTWKQAGDNVVDGMRDMKDVIEIELLGEISVKKSAVVSSDEALYQKRAWTPGGGKS